MNNNSFSYTGIVEYEINGKTYTSKNSGTTKLFNLFAVILCREGFSVGSLPQYFMLYREACDDLISDPVVGNHIKSELLIDYLDTSSYTSNTEIETSSNFVSTLYTTMLQNISSAHSVVSLALISSNKEEILAVVEFSSDVYDIVRKGGQSLIKWTMTVSNSDSLD